MYVQFRVINCYCDNTLRSGVQHWLNRANLTDCVMFGKTDVLPTVCSINQDISRSNAHYVVKDTLLTPYLAPKVMSQLTQLLVQGQITAWASVNVWRYGDGSFMDNPRLGCSWKLRNSYCQSVAPKTYESHMPRRIHFLEILWFSISYHSRRLAP